MKGNCIHSHRSGSHLNIIKKLPETFEMTWNALAHRYMNGKQRNTEKWNRLKERLMELNLIEENNAGKVKRNF